MTCAAFRFTCNFTIRFVRKRFNEPQITAGQVEDASKWHDHKQQQPFTRVSSAVNCLYNPKPNPAVFCYKSLFSPAQPGQQRWTLLGIIVKQGGSIKSMVVWLLDLDRVLKYIFKDFCTIISFSFPMVGNSQSGWC